MRIPGLLRRLGFAWRVAILTLLSGMIGLALNSPGTATWLQDRLSRLFPALISGEVAYIDFILRTLLIGFSLILLVLVVIGLERPQNLRQFFKLGPIDWPGLGLIVLLVAVLDLLEAAFLRRTVYEPMRLFLISLGLWGQPSLEFGFTPDPSLAGFNLLLSILILWIEAPEEIFFRGYVQNQLQQRIGPNAALFLGALIWDAWHLFAPAEFVRRLLFGLAFSLVFRLRQNTTPLAIWHPLGNRLLLVFYIAAPLLGRT